MQTYETVRQVINDINLMNNRFMNKALDGNIPATQTILRIILDNDKIRVISVTVQRFLQNLYGHSAQLDILAEDEEGRRFNVEVQRSDEGSSPKRARFYSSALDMHFLDVGKKYEALPETYVIFITENDVLNEERPLYTVRRHIEESGKTFTDGSHIVYVNAACKDNTPLGKLMQDFACKDPEKMHYKELADSVRYLKNTKEGEVDMTDIIELYAENKAKKAAEAAAKETAEKAAKEAEKAAKKAKREVKKAKKDAEQAERISVATVMLKNHESMEKILLYTKLSQKEVAALAEKLSA